MIGPLVILALAAVSAAAPVAAVAQSTVAPVELRADRFLAFATSAATLALVASELVEMREARPEIRDAAGRIAAERRAQLDRLRKIAGEAAVAEAGLQFEHKIALENLQPLDYLALSRRYAELMRQVVDQEREAYAAAAASADPRLAELGREAVPILDRLDAVIAPAHDSVRP